MIKTVILDLDDTLYDYQAGNRLGMDALKQYCREHFGMEEEAFQEKMKEAWLVVSERMGTARASVHNRLIRYQIFLELIHQPVFLHARRMYHTYWDTLLKHMQISDGAREWMEKLHSQGIQIGMGTNMTAYIQYRKVEHLGIGHLIDWIVTSEEVGVEKPDPKIFQVCVEKSGVTPRECLFVGDNLRGDVQGAMGAGLEAMLYDPHCKVKEAEHLPYRVIHSFRECLAEDFRL